MAMEAMISTQGLMTLGAGIGFGLAALATGIAQKDALPAAIGAISEDPKLFAKALIFTIFPKTTFSFGFVSLFILTAGAAH
jgi:V/A-type H+-transporting ATPase subunit K